MTILYAGMYLAVFSSLAIGQDVTEKEEIRKTFVLKGVEDKRILLDNTDGSIEVKGYDGNEIQLVVRKEIEAESERKIQEAKEEVILDIKEETDKLLIYVDAPWRRSDGSINYRGYEYYGYRVKHDFELRVPKKMSLYLRTVNQGKVTVQDVEGEFEVRNVNEGIEMLNIAGPARVATVNGPIKVTFTKNPKSDCSFKTVNGNVEVEFQEGLSAVLRFKTFNGEVYTDFDVTDLPPGDRLVETKKRGKKVYRRGDFFSVRVGEGGVDVDFQKKSWSSSARADEGGPEFLFNTLNGDIYIVKQK
ncbi:MAG: hypothetical protein L0Y80_08155 [Ignavibacteriae bacterium]|nr:hypothetical protein [Ignavibacteriota bacterium]